MKKRIPLLVMVVFVLAFTSIFVACGPKNYQSESTNSIPSDTILIDNLEPTIVIKSGTGLSWNIYEFTNSRGEYCTIIRDNWSGGTGISCTP